MAANDGSEQTMSGKTEYENALKLGERCFRKELSKGNYPYLPALDSFLRASEVKTEESLGIVDIPLDQIVGTKTAGRSNAFASNFMPLVAEKSEFAGKWAGVFDHQENEGINDPIICYEYMNRFYVQEGNKRVSVMKYLGATSIEGRVTRLIPHHTNSTENRIFYEFIDFYDHTQINYLWFSGEGRFARLCSMCGKSPDEDWTLEERQYFSSRYLRFKKIFEEKGGNTTGITVGDAMLAYLTIFSYDQMDDKPDSAISVELDSLWPEFSSMNADPEEALVMDPEESDNQSLFKRFFTRTGSQTLKIAFIHARYLEDSGWVYSHELGKTHLEQCFGPKVSCKSYFVGEKDERGAAIEKAIEEGAHIIFTTSVQLLEASLKAAIAHPDVKILNCCVNHPHNLMRTYYGRMYEAKFLEGMIAGAMSANDRIAYVADYPIYGTLANINAFARGAAMTNPRSKIWLNWLCCPDQDLTKLLEEQDISIVADLDTVRPGALSRQFGLYEKKGSTISLSRCGTGENSTRRSSGISSLEAGTAPMPNPVRPSITGGASPVRSSMSSYPAICPTV